MFKKEKVIFFIVWLIILAIGPITVFRNIPTTEVLKEPSVLVNVLQRLTGLVAFSLLFIQLLLGAFMQRWIEKLGAWVFNLHLTQGAIIYSLIFLHPLLFVFLNYKTKGAIDPFYVFTDICVLCTNRTELFYTLGRLAFWLITIAVIAAKLRTQPWLRNKWRTFHLLNYVAFILIAFHSRFVGTDSFSAPVVWFWPIATYTVLGIVLYKLYNRAIQRTS